MQLETLSCNNCGAPIDVPLAANYVSCTHCGSRLAIKRTETAHYTEVLERLEELDVRTQDMEAEVQRLRIHNALKTLDEEWEAQREPFTWQTKDGSLYEPSVAGAYAYLALPVIAIIVSPFIFAFISPSVLLAALLFLALLAVSVWAAIDAYNRYQKYSALKATYLSRREALLNELRPSQKQQSLEKEHSGGRSS